MAHATTELPAQSIGSPLKRPGGCLLTGIHQARAQQGNVLNVKRGSCCLAHTMTHIYGVVLVHVEKNKPKQPGKTSRGQMYILRASIHLRAKTFCDENYGKTVKAFDETSRALINRRTPKNTNALRTKEENTKHEKNTPQNTVALGLHPHPWERPIKIKRPPRGSSRLLDCRRKSPPRRHSSKPPAPALPTPTFRPRAPAPGIPLWMPQAGCHKHPERGC